MSLQTETQEQMINRCSNESAFNCSVEDYLWVVMGPRRLPLKEIIPISVFLVVIFLTGIAGNLATCVVIVRHPAMHTATNYYLFSLAVSDLLLLLFGLPNDLAVYWHQYPYSLGIGFCKLRALISEAASYVSVLTIVAFSLERYLAICHPLHLYAMAGLHRAVKIIAALWLVSMAAAAPFAIYTDISYHDYPPNSKTPCLESAFCVMLENPWYLLELSSLWFFIAPGLIMLYLYVRMGLRIRYVMWSRHGRQGYPPGLNGVNGNVHGEARQAKSRKVIIRMLAAVVVAFFLCWAPFHFQRLFFIYGSDYQHFNDINEHLFNVAGALYYVSATVNPILYNVMSNRYRVAFRETLCCGHVPRRGSRYYREHSSFKETTINQCSEATHLVRVRSLAGRRSKLDTKNTYSRSQSSETRSSNVDSYSTELKHIKCHEIDHIINNNIFNDKKKRNSKNLAVNFRTNSVNENKNERKVENNEREIDDASKISIEIYLEPNNKEINDISKNIKDFKRNDLITLVGELTNEKTNTRKDLFIVVGSASKNIEKLCSPDFGTQDKVRDKTETCI